MIKVHVYGRIDQDYVGGPSEYQLISKSLVGEYKGKETELPVLVAKQLAEDVLICVPIDDYGYDVENCGLFVWSDDPRLNILPMPLCKK